MSNNIPIITKSRKAKFFKPIVPREGSQLILENVQSYLDINSNLGLQLPNEVDLNPQKPLALLHIFFDKLAGPHFDPLIKLGVELYFTKLFSLSLKIVIP